MKEPYPNYFGELSDALVRPGINAQKDFLNTWVSPLGGFYEPGKGYDFKAADPADLALSAVSALPIAGKVAKGVRVAAKMPKLNRPSKKAVRETMGTRSILDQVRSGYKSTTTPGGVR